MKSDEIPRRRFLRLASAAGAFLAAHGAGVMGLPAGPGDKREEGERRIAALELIAAAPLAEMAKFYHGSLGLPLLGQEPDALTLKAGASTLAFRTSESASAGAFYHFAFNIPQNKILAARLWQKERTPLLPIPEHLRDPRFPDDVVHYRHWNSHSVFFFDPAGNVVEYIARHDLRNDAEGDFSPADILYASEIGLVVDDVPAAAGRLGRLLELQPYRGASDSFAALGDERGLLLVMKRGRVVSFDSPWRKAVSVFPTSVSLHGRERRQHDFPDYPYRIQVGA